MIRFSIDGVKHEFDDDKFFNFELLALKKVTTEHWTLKEFMDAFGTMDAEAITAMVWFARRREGESELRFTEVEFDVVEFMGSFEEVVDEAADTEETEETDDEADPPAPVADESETPSNPS